MKKNALFMLFAGTVLASCVSEDLNVNPQSQGSAKLTFDSPVMYHNGGTRAYSTKHITQALERIGKFVETLRK